MTNYILCALSAAILLQLFLTIKFKYQMSQSQDQLRADITEMKGFVANVAADVAELASKLENADNIPQDILDDAAALKASLQAAAGQYKNGDE